MRLLAWDTSSKAGAIAALEWDPAVHSGAGFRLISEWTLNVDSTHSERLLWAIHQVLESARWKLKDLDAFAVGVGPGSFTGLRIGITTARTLAHTLGKPLVPLSSLAALARPAASWTMSLGAAGQTPLVVATTDACKGELFALWGRADEVSRCVTWPDAGYPGLWHPSVEETVISPAGLMEILAARLEAPENRDLRWLAVGEGRQRYPEAWARLPRDRELRPAVGSVDFANQVQGRWLALLAWEGFQAELGCSGLLVHPRYVRASDAELRLKAGLLAPAPMPPEAEGKS